MPELNPLTNEQIFLKKIAENTGSNYNTGDVSEINPLTIDQILLKEIAANTAGQSGDITELEEKVADNTSAIGAIVNVNGAKNWALLEPESESKDGITFTCTDGKSLTLSGTASDNTGKSYNLETPITGNVIVTLEQTANKVTLSYSDGTDWHPLPADGKVNGTIAQVGFNMVSGTVINETVYLMIRDARITDPTYVPYAMTNAELTEKVKKYESDPVLLTIINTTTEESYTLSETVNNFKNVCVQLENANDGLFLSNIIPVAILKTKTSWYNSVVFRTTDGANTLRVLFRYVDVTHIEGSVSADYTANIYGLN